MGIIEYLKKNIKRSKERSRAKKASKALAENKLGVMENLYHHGRNLGHAGVGVELDRTRTLVHEWDGQNLAVWHASTGVRDYIKDDAFIKNKEGRITWWGSGITSEKTDLNLLLEVLDERLGTANYKNYSFDSILDVETALENYEFNVMQSKDSLSKEELQATEKMIKKIRSDINEKKSTHLRANLEQKLKNAKAKKFSDDTLPELERALGTFELHIDESKNTQSEESYKDAKKRIEALKKDIRRIKMIKRTTPTVKRDVPKNGTKSNKPKELKGPVRKPRPKGRSLGRS